MNGSVLLGIRRALDWVVSVALVVAGTCLIVGCLHIFYTQDGYSRRIVTDVFFHIAAPVYVCMALVAVSSIWEWASPRQYTHRGTAKDYRTTLARLYKTRQTEDAADAIITETARRNRCEATRATAVAAGIAVFLWYAVQPAHYTADINASVIRAMWVALPCFVIPAVVSVMMAHWINNSFKREIAVLSALPRRDVVLSDTSPTSCEHTCWIVPLVLFLAAVAALVYGFVAGGTVDVLTKAINICTECIGLG